MTEQSNAAKFAEILRSASRDERLEIAKLLGLAPAHRVQRKDRMVPTKEFVRAHGSIVRSANFEVEPPDQIAVLGPEAVRIWIDAWYEGRYLSVDDITGQIEIGETPDPEALAEQVR